MINVFCALYLPSTVITGTDRTGSQAFRMVHRIVYDVITLTCIHAGVSTTRAGADHHVHLQHLRQHPFLQRTTTSMVETNRKQSRKEFLSRTSSKVDAQLSKFLGIKPENPTQQQNIVCF